jgi:hypothetical protein
MRLWCIKNGIPYEVADNFSYWELVSHVIVFSQFENGKDWDWDNMTFISRE